MVVQLFLIVVVLGHLLANTHAWICSWSGNLIPNTFFPFPCEFKYRGFISSIYKISQILCV